MKIEKAEKKAENQPQQNLVEKKDQRPTNKIIDKLEQKAVEQPVSNELDIGNTMKKENTTSKAEHPEHKILELEKASNPERHLESHQEQEDQNYLQSEMEGHKEKDTKQEDENYENNFDKDQFNTPEENQENQENQDEQEEHLDPADLL